MISNYLNQKEIQNEEHFEQYSKQLPIPVLEKSFLKTHPQFEKFWDYKKNYPLRPEHFIIFNFSLKSTLVTISLIISAPTFKACAFI